MFAHSQAVTFCEVYRNPWVRIPQRVSHISCELHICCPTAQITAMSLPVVPQVDEWQRRRDSSFNYSFLPTYFYYKIHHSCGGRKVMLLTAFNISTLPITHFNNSTVQVISLLSVTFKRQGCSYHQDVFKMGHSNLWPTECSPFTHTNRNVCKLKPKTTNIQLYLHILQVHNKKAVCSRKGKQKLQIVLHILQMKWQIMDKFLIFCALSFLRLLK